MKLINNTRTLAAFAGLLAISTASAALWTPTEITTIGWYDASDSANVVTSGTNVTSWKDSSGNGYDLNQAASNPQYGSATINGLNAIHFSNTTGELTGTGINLDVTELFVISVGMPKQPGDWPNLGTVYGTGSVDKVALRLRNGATQGSVSSAVRLDSTTFPLSSGNSVIIRDDEPVMLGVHYDGLNAGMRVNGGALSTNRADATDGATFTINEIQAGRDSNTPRNYHGEMVVIGPADLATIEQVEGYLAWKWGMEDTLPVAHAYKLAAPQIAAAIPEPSSTALLGLGGLALMLRRRR